MVISLPDGDFSTRECCPKKKPLFIFKFYFILRSFFANFIENVIIEFCYFSNLTVDFYEICHSIHGSHAIDVYVYLHQAEDNLIDFSFLNQQLCHSWQIKSFQLNLEWPWEISFHQIGWMLPIFLFQTNWTSLVDIFDYLRFKNYFIKSYKVNKNYCF